MAMLVFSELVWKNSNYAWPSVDSYSDYKT